MATLELRFPRPGPRRPLSQNVALKQRWHLNKKAMDPWQGRVKVELESARHKMELLERRESPVPIVVQVTIPFDDRRERDPHNYTSTVVKAVVDGVKDAGYVPEDTAEWVTVLDPILTDGGDAVVTLTDRPDPPGWFPRFPL